MTKAASVVLAFVMIMSACSDDGGPASAPSTTTSAVPAMTTTVTTTVSTTTTTLAPLTTRTLSVTMESPADLPGHNVYRPADLDAVEAPLPVLVWGNGGCFRHDATWRPLFERWAGAGFLVVTIAAPEIPVEGQPAATDPHSADDQAAGIAWALEQHETAGGAYEGRIDTERVVAAGNSCGGITALALAGRDRRVTAVFVLSGSSVGPGASREAAEAVMADVSVPVGFAVGGPEDIASAQADQDYEVQPAGVAGFVASRPGADHVTVSTDPAILAEVGEIGLNWMDLTLYGGQAAREAISGIPCSGCEPGLWNVTTKHLDTLPVDIG